jgi:hypothetical protein
MASLVRRLVRLRQDVQFCKLDVDLAYETHSVNEKLSTKRINVPDVINGNIIMLFGLFPSNTLLFMSVLLAYIYIHLTKSKCLGLDEGSWGAKYDDDDTSSWDL